MTEVKNQEGKVVPVVPVEPWNRAVDIAKMTPKKQEKAMVKLGQEAETARGEAPEAGSGLAGTGLQRRRGAIIRRGR